jgi:glycerol-3-phosphate dehydrogenase subunit B
VKSDSIVIGAGLAGLVTAIRLAEEGQKVLVLATGVGSTHLAPGTIDVLGYWPERVDSPAEVLPDFTAAHPEHPYAGMNLPLMSAAVEWLKSHVRAFDYVGSLDRNLLLPTAVGALKPSAIVSETMAAGDVTGGAQLVVAGPVQLKDFYPAYAADNLDGTSLDDGCIVTARAVELQPDVGGDSDVTPLSWARRFEDPEFRKLAIEELTPHGHGASAIGLPAVLGLAEARMVWQELQDGIGCPVFEIPTLPPSVPGMRLFGALKGALQKAGATLVLGGRVIGAERSGARITGVISDSAGRPKLHEGSTFVLATGGFSSGGLEMDSHGHVRESVFGLPVAGVPGPEEPRFDSDYWKSHPMGGAGIAVNGRGMPVDGGGEVLFDNLYAAGATLAGAEPWLEKSGDGISLTTGIRAAEAILEEAA